MNQQAHRKSFTLRDPSALGALLIYDWRLRRVLTDAEALASVDGPISTSVLRHLQRLGLIRALHGVRPQGGRMRLWSVEDVLKVQAALDLRAVSGARLSRCAEALIAHGEAIAAVLEGWEAYAGRSCDPVRTALREGDAVAILTRPDALERLLAASICGYVNRNRFTEVSAPAFLL